MKICFSFYFHKLIFFFVKIHVDDFFNIFRQDYKHTPIICSPENRRLLLKGMQVVER